MLSLIKRDLLFGRAELTVWTKGTLFSVARNGARVPKRSANQPDMLPNTTKMDKTTKLLTAFVQFFHTWTLQIMDV